jgi:hypothetical protein
LKSPLSRAFLVFFTVNASLFLFKLPELRQGARHEAFVIHSVSPVIYGFWSRRFLVYNVSGVRGAAAV